MYVGTTRTTVMGVKRSQSKINLGSKELAISAEFRRLTVKPPSERLIWAPNAARSLSQLGCSGLRDWQPPGQKSLNPGMGR